MVAWPFRIINHPYIHFMVSCIWLPNSLGVWQNLKKMADKMSDNPTINLENSGMALNKCQSQEPWSSDIELPDSKDNIIEEMLSLKGIFILLLSICYNRHYIKKCNNFNVFMLSNSTKKLNYIKVSGQNNDISKFWI